MIHFATWARVIFVSIQNQNIKQGLKSEFQIYNLSLGYRPITPYDYNSIMHYEAPAFSANGISFTIVAKKNRVNAKVPDKPPEKMSRFDIIKLNKHNNCGENMRRCKDANNEKWCRESGLSLQNGIMNPDYAKCVDETWSQENYIKTCGYCYRVLNNNINGQKVANKQFSRNKERRINKKKEKNNNKQISR